MQKSLSAGNAGEKAKSAARGRPRAFDRQAALAQATRLFWLKGYEGTSITDLTAAMGIGATSLYAAFGSKDALYVEALHHYGAEYDSRVWANFFSASTAREAVMALLSDSAAALASPAADMPSGCMVTLSSVGSEDHPELAKLVRSGRAAALDRIESRLRQAVAEKELSDLVDLHSLGRFIQAVLSGMSILARDGASPAELQAIAEVAMLKWDATAGDP